MKRIPKETLRNPSELHEEIAALVVQANLKILEFNSVGDGLWSEASDWFGDRTQRWQESEAGTLYEAWLNGLEDSASAIEEIEEPPEMDEMFPEQP